MAGVLFGATDAWTIRTPNDRAACALADRHYSRQTPGCGQVGPSGRKLVLVTADETAVWLTHWPEWSMDGLDAWRCSIFRNEGEALSSDLIRSAMALTAAHWAARPRDGWVTFVNRDKVATGNPGHNHGYCFLRAGWWKDPTYRPDRRRRHLIRLRADLAPVSSREGDGA